MATRSYIGKVNQDQTISAIYCHWDGYPSNNGRILLHNYETEDKVDLLLSKGHLSILGESVNTSSYYEDDGNKFPMQVRDLSVLFNEGKNCWIEYYYLYDNGYWKCFDYDCEPISIVEAIKEAG
jgi:hypothetical protein